MYNVVCVMMCKGQVIHVNLRCVLATFGDINLQLSPPALFLRVL
jgi:hypothetical protein